MSSRRRSPKRLLYFRRQHFKPTRCLTAAVDSGVLKSGRDQLNDVLIPSFCLRWISKLCLALAPFRSQ